MLRQNKQNGCFGSGFITKRPLKRRIYRNNCFYSMVTIRFFQIMPIYFVVIVPLQL